MKGISMKFIPLLFLGFTSQVNAEADCTERASSLELYILQDFTSSFKNYIATAKSLIPQVTTALKSEFENFKVGMGFFGDKPTKDFPNDKCFESLVELTADVDSFNEHVETYSGTVVNGGDGAEDSLEVMAYAAGSGAGYTTGNVTGLRRVVFLITDVSGHYGPDDGTKNEYITSGLPSNDDLGTELMCDTAMYPTLDQVKAVMHEAQVYPIVLVDEKRLEWWTNILQTSLGYTNKTSLVESITMDASDLVETMTDTLLRLECQLQEVETPGTGGSTPDTTSPDGSTPGTTPDTGGSTDGTTPDGSTPGSGGSTDGTTPDGSTPGSGGSTDGTTPDGSTPGSGGSTDGTTPDGSTPGSGGSTGGSTPDGSTPGSGGSTGGSTPDGSTPGTGGSTDGTTPDGSTPGTGGSTDGTTPDGSTPGTGGSTGGSTPDGATPGTDGTPTKSPTPTEDADLAASESATTEAETTLYWSAPLSKAKIAAIAVGTACGGLAVIAGIAYAVYATMGTPSLAPAIPMEVEATSHPADPKDRDTYTKANSEDYNA